MKLGVFFCLWIFSSCLYAGTITLTQSTTASIVGNSLSIELNLKNEGDTSAHNVTPRVLMVGKNILLPTISELKAGQSYSQATSTSLGNDINGEYHIVALTYYEDEKGIRHISNSQLYLNSVPIDEHPISLGLILESSDKTEIRVKGMIQNQLNKDFPLKLQVIVPDDIATNPLIETLNIKAMSSDSFPLILNAVNFNDFGESLIYVIARYSINDIQHSQLISIPINQNKQDGIIQSFFSTQYLLLMFGGLFVLILVFTFSQNVRRS